MLDVTATTPVQAAEWVAGPQAPGAVRRHSLAWTHPAAAWGTAAPQSVSVNYSSVALAGSAGHFRLSAHVAGEPYSRQYCVDHYTPGAVVRPSDMKTECWVGAGDTLASFRQVDAIGLLRVSEHTSVGFDFCVTAVFAD
jgi:hypothetical protein